MSEDGEGSDGNTGGLELRWRAKPQTPRVHARASTANECAMSTRFNQRCLDILHSNSVKEFSKNVADTIQSLGMTTIGISVITEHAPGITEFKTMTNAPDGYVSDFENLELAKLDPVSQHCKRSSEPVVWDQKFYVSRGRGDFWENQAAF